MNDGAPRNETAGSKEALERRLVFTRKLQAITQKIHATDNVEQIMLGLSGEICALLEADRLTIYAATPDGSTLVAKVKTGLEAFRTLKVAIGPESIAGYAAHARQLVNIKDAYDDAELAAIDPELNFLKDVDRRTGYRTRQVLAAPIINDEGELLGALQAINTLSGEPFPPQTETAVQELTRVLAVAFKQRREPWLVAMRSKFAYLTREGAVSSADFDEAAYAAQREKANLETVLTERYKVPRKAVGEALAEYHNVPYEPFRNGRSRPAGLLDHFSRDFAVTNGCLPVAETESGRVVFMVTDAAVGSQILHQVYPNRRIEVRVTTEQDFHDTVDQLFGGGYGAGVGALSEILSSMDPGEEEGADETAGALEESDNEVVRLVNRIIVDAYQQGASDIHIEPGSGREKVRVRFRRDGTLMPYTEIPASYRYALCTRVKVMSDLDIAERRKPQDGKIKFKRFGPLDIELRVATVPTAGGVEDVVLRLLAAGEPIPMEDLGLRPHNMKAVREIIHRPHGIFFVCGPTGSGKTTTLHSLLAYINTPETKIWTAEDPVEITQKGLRQVQMNPRAGVTFASAMRSFLRADPDVIMVGEMRDQETVSTGIEASLTGHLVFSTLHTNSAPESIVRLLDMGMDPFNFADALLGVLAQRLVKRLCPACKTAYQADESELAQLVRDYVREVEEGPSPPAESEQYRQGVLEEWRSEFGDAQGRITLYHAAGCDECDHVGYKGRLGLHELLTGTPEVKCHIQQRGTVSELVGIALNQGMHTLKQDGIEKVLLGETDLSQVRTACIV